MRNRLLILGVCVAAAFPPPVVSAAPEDAVVKVLFLFGH
jgi:hypothetical protein